MNKRCAGRIQIKQDEKFMNLSESFRSSLSSAVRPVAIVDRDFLSRWLLRARNCLSISKQLQFQFFFAFRSVNNAH